MPTPARAPVDWSAVEPTGQNAGRNQCDVGYCWQRARAFGDKHLYDGRAHAPIKSAECAQPSLSAGRAG
jgi:hypothetical protein